MNKLDTPLIADKSKRLLSALGHKQMYRFIDKACRANNTHRLMKDAKPLVEQVRGLVMALIFEHNVTKEQLSELQKSIKVTNGQLQLPSIATNI